MEGLTGSSGSLQSTQDRPGVELKNGLIAAFYACRSPGSKKTVKLSVFFVLSGSARTKAARKTLMKLTPVINFNFTLSFFIKKFYIKLLCLQFQFVFFDVRILAKSSRHNVNNIQIRGHFTNI